MVVKDGWQHLLVTVVVAAITSAGTIWVSTADNWSTTRAQDIQMVEIAISILKSDPKEGQIAAAREWALDVIDTLAPVRFSAQARNELLLNPLAITWFADPEKYIELLKGPTSAPSGPGSPRP